MKSDSTLSLTPALSSPSSLRLDAIAPKAKAKADRRGRIFRRLARQPATGFTGRSHPSPRTSNGSPLSPGERAGVRASVTTICKARRLTLAPTAFATLLVLASLYVAFSTHAADTVEQWGVYEITLPGPTNGTPFLDVRFAARFAQGYVSLEVPGFYDGDGSYRVRFMPDKLGAWKFETISSAPALNGKTGEFRVTKPAAGNHGPVRVANTFHFAYADGTPYKQLGTTCYVWTHQPEALQEQTLKALAAAPFNKIRFCVFPDRKSVV